MSEQAPPAAKEKEKPDRIPLPDEKDEQKKIVKKKDALPFKVPKNISLVVVDAESGLEPNANTKKII